MEIAKYLMDEESQVLERKPTLADPKKIAHTICAFANTEGGVFLIGVDDKGRVIGLEKQKLDSIQKSITELIKECKPIPSANIEIREAEGKFIVATLISKIFDSVCFYDGRVWVRTGPTNRQLSSSELIEFLKQRQMLNFEDQATEANIEDIDRKKLDMYLQKRGGSDFKEKETADLLFNLKLLRDGKVTNLAVLFFAKDIARLIPYAEIRLVRFKGTEAVDIINTSRVVDTVPELIESSISFIRVNTKTRYEIKEIRREDITEYPLLVIREAISNAIGHRDYFNQNSMQVSIFDDRIEITNPGHLPMELTLKDLGRLAVHRNPRLYQMLSLADYVEGYGTGVPRMIQRMRERGLPDPVFEEIGNFFRITLYNEESKKAIEQYGLNPIQQKILSLVKGGKNKSRDIARECSLSIPTIVKNLAEMEKKGMIKRIGMARDTHYEAV